MTITETTLTGVTTDGIQARLDEYWSGRAEAYHHRQVAGDRAPHDHALWLEVWGRALPPAPVRVLDVGTGSGYVASILAELGHEVTGLDSSPGMVAEALADAARRRASGRPAASFVRGDAVDPQGVGTDLDVVTSRYLLWTLRDPASALRAWMRLLRPGGTVACVDANWYPGGFDREVQVESTAGPDAFVEAYDADAEAHLPLATAADAEAYRDLFTGAGLTDVTVTRLDAVAELDRRFGMSPGHESRPQYLVTGRTPRA